MPFHTRSQFRNEIQIMSQILPSLVRAQRPGSAFHLVGSISGLSLEIQRHESMESTTWNYCRELSIIHCCASVCCAAYRNEIHVGIFSSCGYYSLRTGNIHRRSSVYSQGIYIHRPLGINHTIEAHMPDTLI